MAGKTDPEGREPDAEESAAQNPPDEGGHSEHTDRQQEDDFDAGWGGEPKGEPTSDDGQPEGETDDDGESATGDDEPGDEPAEDQPSQEGAADEPGEQTPTRDEPESVDQAKQELKTWQGRLKKAREEAERLERELQAKKEQAQSDEPPPETDAQREARERVEEQLTDEEKQLLEGMRQEYPDIYRAMEIVAKKTSGETVKERLPRAVDQLRQERIDPALQRVQETEQATHYAEIQRAHPDVGDHVESGQLREWIESQPYKDAQQMLEIYERGTPAQAIQLLDQFKQAKGITTPPPPTDKSPDPRRQQQLEASAAVRRRSGGPPKTSSKDDFEAGWDMGR